MKRPSVSFARATTAVMLGAVVFSSAAFADVTARQTAVAQHGAEVMPFSLAATTHIFTKTATGGVQQVVTKRHDPKQVALIREHMTVIARNFAAGDFGAPETIHGSDMPGLSALRAAQPGELKVSYRDLRNGGEIVYRANGPRLVDALHKWFDAQLSDHGHDAMAGHDPGMIHHHAMDASTAK
ncbi:aspartate carbamoyltransferase [Pandoraea terrigena]|uniref:Membrane associated protein n=1 Tax=Pandoraea terrigena TaxID=2508292 RepID=A0A5E4REJ0_9BURK|nr:aspartate carbamoyltransferase [Pandoraea terrigena]VVD61243.1 membrane associated protein [Pandoraea terrigena]